MAGVFELEVDGVEHDHRLEHHDEPNQVGVIINTKIFLQGQVKMFPDVIAAFSVSAVLHTGLANISG